jgi:hypothetical protein
LQSLPSLAVRSWLQTPPLQVSRVHSSSSPQSLSVPTQVPLSQWSSLVQSSPSSQVPVVKTVLTQPVAVPSEGAQLSVVHGLPSSQLRGAPGLQVPAAQASGVVQTLPSLHGALLGVWVQPTPSTQASSVQRLLSRQGVNESAAQVPALQTAGPQAPGPVLQTNPSLPAAENAQLPVFVSQLSAVQPLPSVQGLAGPATQSEPWQASPTVQALLSSQVPALGLWLHDQLPALLMQASTVQALLSSQSWLPPPLQVPPSQVSAVVHASPSSQSVPLAVGLALH